jgi:hypothetical protein
MTRKVVLFVLVILGRLLGVMRRLNSGQVVRLLLPRAARWVTLLLDGKKAKFRIRRRVVVVVTCCSSAGGGGADRGGAAAVDVPRQFSAELKVVCRVAMGDDKKAVAFRQARDRHGLKSFHRFHDEKVQPCGRETTCQRGDLGASRPKSS